MKDRLESIRQKCSHYMQDKYWQTFRQSGDVLAYEEEHIYFCIVPKTGNTFWKRIMRFLGKDYPERQNINRPLDIDRHFVHERALKNLKMWKVHNPISRMLMTKGKTFMFARNPYTRLWSAYIDKLFLPDFWHKDAVVIINKLRSNVTQFERKCANNVSFYEFLKFVTITYTKGLDNHWERLHRVCSPCHVQFDVIGKQETFRLDSEYILTRFGLEFLKENTTELDMTGIEITTISKYNFDLEKTIKHKCFDKIDVANRLWIAFQYNGYIDRLTPFPKSDLLKTNFLDNTTGIFTELVFRTIKYQNRLGINVKSQKRTMMLEAYRNIPKQLLEDIGHVYEYDFELFGYKPQLFDD
ncbi:carbohydrate sulfotransferase 11-like [Ruditapes philippinarum]|uniref:carbohydrate sulfotransferase 11-like n=1 Tax=Ruditapes philippinarum TaxID=129788 RepID=UPI00295AA0B8|nr:carbohydrate sulfotransferase 11-like [Ruditapes philippinarum]